MLCWARCSKESFCRLSELLCIRLVREKTLRADFAKAGKKLDMGKSCIRFKKLDDLNLDAIGRAVAEVPVDEYIAVYEASRKKK